MPTGIGAPPTWHMLQKNNSYSKTLEKLQVLKGEINPKSRGRLH